MSLASTRSWSCNRSIEVQETDGSSSLVSELQASQRLPQKEADGISEDNTRFVL